MSAHSVSPPADGTTWAESSDAFAASEMYELSVCQPSLPRKDLKRSVGLLVTDRHRLLFGIRSQELDLPEMIGECHLRLCCQTLSGKDQDRILVEGLLHGLPGARIHPGKVEVGDNGPQRGIDRRDLWLHGIPS